MGSNPSGARIFSEFPLDAKSSCCCVERYSQKYSFVVPSVILDTQMATKSDVFSSYFVYSVFISRVTFLVELQIQLHTPVKSNMIIILLKINLLGEI